MTTTVVVTIPVLNISCAGCASAVAETLRKQRGVSSVEVRFADKTARVEYDPSLTTPSLWQEAIRRAGYDIIVADDSDDRLRLRDEAERRSFGDLGRRTAIALVLAAALIAIGMTPLMHDVRAGYASAILSTIALLVCGLPFYVDAVKQARNLRVNMNTLVAVSATVAWVYSLRSLMIGSHTDVYFETSGVLIAFILAGRWLESRAGRKTSAAIRSLITLSPRTASVILPDGSVVEKNIVDLSVGDVVWVAAGNRIPADGRLISGHSFVDESPITGESLPSEKLEGSTVYAGTMNASGSFYMRVARMGGDTFLAQMIRLVDEARNSAPALKTVDKVVAAFVPAVIAIALISSAIWFFFGGDAGADIALSVFVAVLVIACPCALGLAAPMAVMVGIGKGAEQGILIKNMDSLETLRKIDTVILDKTGTITAGRPTVIRRLWITPDTVRFLNILYTMERSASHPLGEAIARYISELGSEVGMNEVKLSVELIPGKGVKAVGEESIWYAGRSSLFPPQIITDEVAEWISESESEGQTVVIFGSETRIIALFSLSDAIKPGSIRAVTALRKSGIYTIMSTGDNQAAARSVARKAGIYEYYWQSLPQDKLDLVMQKRREGRIVAMVGDGVNDSAALAASHVGIAMGKGSEAAIETASLTIVSGDLEKIPAALKLSADTVAVIRQNLFWAFFYNALAIPIAAGVLYPFCGFLLNPMIAGGAMALSSLSVVMNSLRFNRLKPAS